MTKAEEHARQLAGFYHSAEPSVICEKMGVVTLEQDLPPCVKGFTLAMNGTHFIVLNNVLADDDKRFTLAHELGHIILHKGTNSLQLRCQTDFCVTKYEREADGFAAWLLLLSELSELSGRESVTAEEAARIAHIPPAVAQTVFIEDAGV